MARVLSRGGAALGAASARFGPDDLLRALADARADPVYAEDAGAGAQLAARVCVRARLAPSAPARTVELELCAGGLRLRLACALPPRGEMLLWFAPDALAALDMPFLTPRHVRARRDYQCDACGAAFPDPNPLKVHLFLRCAPPEPARFWREAAARLRAADPPAPSPPPAAQLEALAAAWGRSRAGHVCVYCGKLHARRYGLKIHLRTHTGYRPLRCRHCQRAFGDPSNLNKHERLHARAAAAREQSNTRALLT